MHIVVAFLGCSHTLLLRLRSKLRRTQLYNANTHLGYTCLSVTITAGEISVHGERFADPTEHVTDHGAFLLGLRQT